MSTLCAPRWLPQRRLPAGWRYPPPAGAAGPGAPHSARSCGPPPLPQAWRHAQADQNQAPAASRSVTWRLSKHACPRRDRDIRKMSVLQRCGAISLAKLAEQWNIVNAWQLTRMQG